MDEAKKLRVALDGERTKGRGARKPGFSPGLKEKVVDYLLRERAKGRGVVELITSIGISRPTYYEWVGGKRRRSTEQQIFRKVAELPTVTPVPSGATSIAVGGAAQRLGSGSRIVVVGPTGIAVLGMSVVEVAELVRRLAC